MKTQWIFMAKRINLNRCCHDDFNSKLHPFIKWLYFPYQAFHLGNFNALLWCYRKRIIMDCRFINHRPLNYLNLQAFCETRGEKNLNVQISLSGRINHPTLFTKISPYSTSICKFNHHRPKIKHFLLQHYNIQMFNWKCRHWNIEGCHHVSIVLLFPSPKVDIIWIYCTYIFLGEQIIKWNPVNFTKTLSQRTAGVSPMFLWNSGQMLLFFLPLRNKQKEVHRKTPPTHQPSGSVIARTPTQSVCLRPWQRVTFPGAP